MLDFFAVDRFGEDEKSCTYFEVEKGLLEARHGDGVVLSSGYYNVVMGVEGTKSDGGVRKID